MRTPRIVAGATAAVLAIGLLAAAPAAASGLSAPFDPSRTTTNPTGEIRLAWGAVAGATGYTVEVASDPTFSTASIVDKATTRSLAWVPTTGLWGSSDERELFWRVVPQGVNATPGDASVQHFTREAAPVPALVSPADGANVAYPTPVQLTWNPVPGAVSYSLAYALEGSSTWTTLSNLTSTSYTPTTLLRGRYSWKVSASFVASGTSTATYQGPSSPVRSFSSTWAVADATPKNLLPAPGTTVNDVVLSWDQVAGASAYRVELSRDPKFSTLALSSTVVGTVFAPAGLLPNGTYYWRVIPLDTAANPATLPAPPENPSAEELLAMPHVRKVLSGSASSVPGHPEDTTKPVLEIGSADPATPQSIDFNDFELSWTPVPRATFYEIQVSQINGTGSVTCQTASTSATIIANYVATGSESRLLSSAKDCLWSTTAGRAIRPGFRYQAKVRAVDMPAGTTTSYQGRTGQDADVVASVWSDPTYIDVTTPAPSTTEGFVPDVSGLQTISETSPELSWAPMVGATGYKVELWADISEQLEGSTPVAVLWTPTPSLRVNGVFAVNQAVTQDAYLAVITPQFADLTKTPSLSSPWSDLLGKEVGKMTWKRLAATPTAGTATPAGAQWLLNLEPAAAESLGGANRGYVVQILDSSDSVAATIKTDQPATVALKSISGTNPVTMTALPKGAYTFRWALLDATGTPGPYSPRTSFTIGASTVSNLAASPLPGGTAARLSWVADVSASSFEVAVKDESGNAIAVPSGKLQTTSVVIDSLVPGKRYTWSVVSVDKDGNRSEVNPGDAFEVPISSVVAMPTTGAQSLPGLVLDWEPVAGASRYLVRIGKAGSIATSAAVETAATQYVPTTANLALAYGTDYVWDVRAVPAKQISSATRPIIAASAEHPLTVRTVPGIPTGARATVAGRTITVAWNALTGAATGSDETPSYTVEYRSGTGPWSRFGTTANATSLTVTGLALATLYEFRVLASNAVGAGAYSSVVQKATASFPGAPQNVRASSSANTLSLSWSAPASNGGAPVTGYTVRYRTAGRSWVEKSTPSTSLKIDGLAAATSYEIEIAALNAVGAGAVAVITTATSAAPVPTPTPTTPAPTPTPTTPPSAPRGLKVVRGDKKAKATWSAPSSTGGSPITGYTVEMRSLSGRTWGSWARKTSTSGARSASISGLKNGTTYQVRVIAQTKVGKSPATSAVKFVPAGKPLAPKVKASSTKKKTVKVTWKAASSNGSKVTGYKVQYSTNGKTWKTIKSLSSKSRSYTWTKGKSKKSYYFRVQAKNSVGSGAYGKTTKVRVK